MAHPQQPPVVQPPRHIVVRTLLRQVYANLPLDAFYAFQEGAFKCDCMRILTRGGYTVVESAGASKSKAHAITATPQGQLQVARREKSDYPGYFTSGSKPDLRVLCAQPLLLELKVMPPMGSLSSNSTTRFCKDLDLLYAGRVHGVLQLHHAGSYDFLQRRAPSLFPRRHPALVDVGVPVFGAGTNCTWVGTYVPDSTRAARTFDVVLLYVNAARSATGTAMVVIGVFDTTIGV